MKSLEEAFGLESPRGAATPEDLKSYLIERANFHGVDPRLAASIFEQESSSGRNAGTSSAGARGPMQVMPATFRQMYPDGDINDPRHNVEAGIRYLKHGRDTLGTDDPRLLAAGYYQGYNRDSLKRGEIVDTNPDPRHPSVQRYADEVTGRVPRMKSLEEALGLEESSVFPIHKGEPQKTAATPAKRNAFAYVNDFMIDAGNAVAGLAKAGVDFAAPGSGASQAIDEFIKQGQAAQSDWKKASREKLHQDLKAAPDEWSKAGIYLSHAVVDDPLGLVAEAGGNIGPFAVFGKALQAARIAEPVAEKIAMGLASMLSVGEVRGNIYDKIQATPDAELQRVNPDYARARQTMTEAQAKKEFGTQFVQHLPELALAAVVGALGGKYGLEALAVGVGPKVARGGRAVIGTVDEGGQGAVEQLATNVGVGRVDPRQTLGEDVPLNATMEGLIGGAGGALSGAQGQQQAPAPRPQPQPGQAVPPNAPAATPADAEPGGGIPASAEDLLPGDAAAPAPQPQPQPQPNAWTEKGVEYRVVPVDEMLWHKYIRPDSQARVDSFEEYRQRYPTITHMRLKSTDGGQTWKPSRAPFIGSEEKLLASRPPETPVMEAPEEVPKAEEVAPNPEQRPAEPVAESQAPVAASGEAQGDAGVAPGQAAEAPESSSGQISETDEKKPPKPTKPTTGQVDNVFRPGGLKPGTPEYEAAFDAWSTDQQERRDKAEKDRLRAENETAAQKRNGWRNRFKEWFLGASAGDTFTDSGTGGVWKVVEKVRKNGTKTKSLLGVDQNGEANGATGISVVGDRVEGLHDGSLDENGFPNPETSAQSLAVSLGILMESGEGVTTSAAATSEPTSSDVDASAHQAATSPKALVSNDKPKPAATEPVGPGHGALPAWAPKFVDWRKKWRTIEVSPGVWRIAGLENANPISPSFEKESLAEAWADEQWAARGQDEPKSTVRDESQGQNPPSEDARSDLDAAAHAAATSPTNDLPEPTPPQKEAGNYQKGHIRIAGLDISIENPQGSKRSGVDRGGKSWEVEMSHHYGYIRGTVGKDKDHIDVFVKPGTPEDYDGPVFVVDQKDPGTHEFDEHKVMLGFDSLEEAKAAYRSNYAQDWRGMQAIGTLPMAEFKAWLKEGDTTKPLAPVSPPKKPEPPAENPERKALPKEDMGAMFDDVLAEELAKDEAKKAPEPVKGGGWDRLEIVSTGFDDGSFIVREPNGRHDGSEQKYARFKLNDKGRPIAVEHFYEHSKAPVQAIIDKWAKDRKAPAAKPPRKDKAPPTPKWAADLKVKKGDQFLFKQEFDYVEAGEVVRVTEFSSDSVQIWNDKKNAGTFLKRWQMEKAIRDGIAVQVIAPKREAPTTSPLIEAMNTLIDLRSQVEAQGRVVDDRLLERVRRQEKLVADLQGEAEPDRTAAAATASAVTNTAAALNAAIDGLGALFGGGGKLSSGLSFDEETYAKAKPLFQQAIAHFQAAGTDLKDAMRAIVRMVLDKFGADAMNAMKPYVVRFMEDVRDGKIRTQQEEGNGPEVDSGTEPGSAPIPPVGEDGSAADRGRGGEGEPGTAPGNGEVLGGTPTPDVSAPGAGPDRKPGSGAGAEDGRGRDGEPGSRDVPDGREGASGEGLAPDGTGSATDVTVPAPPKQPTLGNYHILDPESLIGGSPKVRFDRNKAAIETFRLLQDEGRDPTKEERDTLARYIGWGSFGQELFLGSWDRPRPKPGWEEADKWLRAHLGQKEWESAQRSIINAHYTDPPTVTTMWAMVRRMGFKGGRVLEPSVGIGNFLGLMPRDLEAASQLTGIELDALTGGMASMLYPDANIQIKGYQDSATADHFYDLVIGNWPFDARGPSDRRYRLISPSLHDYFFLKAVDQVKPGGIVIGITSSGTMDKQGKLARLDLARRADLIASFRLPSGAFEKYAGTAVVTDIIVLRKRGEPNAHPEQAGWIETVQIDTPQGAQIRVNEYYDKHRDQVLGTLNYGHGTTQGRPGMIVDRPADLMQRLAALPDRVPEGVFDPRPGGKSINYVRNSTADRENSVVEGEKGGLFVVRGEFMAPLHEIVDYRVKDAKKTKAREGAIRALINMRRAYGALVDAERDGDPAAEDRRKELNRQYRSFVKDSGALNRSDALTWMRKVGDPFWPALAALERKSGDSYVPARILTEATVRTKRKMDKPSVRDAFVLGRNESMRIDMARIAEQAGVAEAQAAKELLDSGAVFKMPDGSYEARDVYLSGNVRRKMREALEAKASGEDMERNIAALKDVVPEDTPYYKIEAKLGAPWIALPHYRQYVADLLKLTEAQRDKLGIAFRLGTWKVNLDDDVEHKPEARSVWGTSRVNFGRVLAAAFNNTKITVWDQHSDGSRSVNEGETGLVTERIGRLREEFSDWVWKDYDRRMALEREFNEVMNAEADPQFDGSFLTLEGMALHRGESSFSLRQHQINAIWRGLVNRRGVYAHEVGTGKTYTMGGLAVESRRYGLARKPLLLAHNANARSVAREIQEMYPAARVLYLGGLDKDSLPVAMRQIANDDWDAVIIPHSRIGMFGLRKETLMAMAAEEIAAMEQEAIEAAEEKNIELTVAMMDEFDNPRVSGRVRDATAKELVKARNAIIARIEDMAQKASKDGAIPFEELGVDMILVDEAHEFGKPPLATKMALRGLNKSTSNRSLSLRFLTSYVRSVNGGTGVHLFTGTPITNTLNEIYNLQRYVSQDIMERDGVSDWDSWFNTFADSTTDVELNAAGQYEPVTRLASFVNVAELRRMIGSYTDIVFADDMPEFAPRPTATGKTMSDEGLSKDEIAELVNGRTENPVGRPYKKIVNDVGAMSPEQMEILSSLQKLATMFKNAGGKARMEMMRSGHPASPVILETNASNAAMDARLFDITAPDFEGSKVNRCVRNVAKHYAEHPLATQVIFLERGFSDESVRTKKDASGNVIKTKVKKFNLVNDIVEKLAAQGVKRSEIAVVAGGISDEKKKEIADAMNRAEIRVVIGQTATLGVGVNMQVNLRAMHHMDAPWRPGDLEQRNGRGHRQGNKWNTVLEYRYITDRLDGRRWQVLAVKERFIKAFLKADKNVRIIEGDAASMDEDDDILGSLSEAAGDPRILLLNKYKQDVERLENRQRTHMLGRQDAQHRLRSVLGQIEGLKKTLVLARKDAETVETLKDRDFAAEVNGKAFTDRKAFDEALKAHVETLGVEERDQKVASVYEIPLTVHRPSSNAPPEFTLKMALRQAVSPSSGSIEAVLRGAKNRAAKIEARIDELQRSIPSLEEAIVAPFPREADLTKKRDLYAQVEADLDINPVPPPAWLRQSAPVGTEIRVAGKAYPVSGHQYAKDGYYVIVETKDGARLVPYLFATDEAGQPLYEPRKFEAPPERGPRPLKVGEFVTLNADKTHWKVKKAPYEVKNGDQKRTVLKIQSVEDEDNERVVGETDITRDETDVGAKRWEIRKLELTPAELRRAKLAAGIADEEPRTADFDYLERMATAFSRSDRRTAPFRPSRAMRVRDVEVAIAPIRAVGRGLPTVHVVQRVTDLPRELVKQIRADGSIVRGVFYHGQIYLIADNLGSPAETVFTMLHEAAHFGLKSVFGAEIDAVLMKIYRDNETVRRAADRRRARYPSLSQVKAVEEVLADWAGKNVEPSILQRLVAWVRDWFRRRGVQLQMTNADVLAIIARARGAWQRPSASRWTHVYSAPRQSQHSPIYYSQLAKAVAQAKFDQAPASQWGSWLSANMAKLGVKADEIEWSGIREWLAVQDGKVGKSALFDYLAQGGVRVEETVYGSVAESEALRIIREAGYDVEEDRTTESAWLVDANGESVDLDDDEVPETVRDALLRLAKEESGTPTKFSEYTLPGGENYREVLLTLPTRTTAGQERAEYEAWAQRNSLTPNATMTEQRYERETGRTAPAPRTMTEMEKDRAQNYQSSHWSQPNVLAHIRVNDRTDADGKRVLFVEEIQSDWAQEGRKNGFTDAEPEDFKVEVKRVGSWHPQFPDEGDKWRVTVDGQDRGYIQASDENEARYKASANERNRRDTSGTVPAAPFVTKTESWVALALKRVLRMAAEGGYDRVAFITGAQSAERYDLSKQISALNVWKMPDGRVGLIAKRQGEIVMQRTVAESQLPDIVGKDLAERISKQPVDVSRDYTGLDLRVGGQGMLTFYDQIVPGVLSDVLRKVGGGSIMTKVSFDDGGRGWTVQYEDGGRANENMTEREAREKEEDDGGGAKAVRIEPQSHLGIEITPQIRERVMGGLPLFSAQPSSAEDFAASTLSLLSDIEDLYQQPKSDKKTLTEIAAEIDPGIKVLEMGSTAWNLDGMAIITMPDGVQAMIRTYKDGAVDIDASLFVEGVTRGTAAYNLAATYAHNNGWMFIGDPAGLTDAALFRRTENMISSAMKFETTDHLYPHERQVAEGLQWEDGKDNLANLLKFSRELLAREMPEAADLVYDVDAKEFRNERTGENLDEAAFRDLARESRGARAARAGEATLKRAALLNTLVRATSPEARRSILGQVVRQLREGLDPALVGTFYSRKSPPGSRPASAAPSQAPQQAGLDVSGLRQRAQNFLDRAKMEVDPFAFVPDRKALETMRYQLLGRIARFDEIAADIKTIFSTASEEDQQAAYRYFLTPGADKAMIPNPSVAAMAERTKALIESVGDALVARGAMTPEVREAHRGRYLPQVYLKFLLGDQNWKALGAGKKISDRGYLKQRKLDRRVGDDGEVHVYDAQTGDVLDQEFLDAVLGPVEDPGYLSSLAIVRPMRDMAILDYLAAIAENAQWVLPKSVIEWRGKRVSAHWAKVEAERLRRQSRHQSEPDAGNARKIAEELDVLADEALGEIEGEHADYRQIPNTARYGRLRGIWVRKEIYDDLMGVNDFLPADPGWAMSLLGYGGIGTRLTSLWKAGKVSLNPPAQVRNFVSNMVLLQLSGVPLRRIPTLFVRAFRQIMLYNEYRRGGRALSPEERARVRHYLVALKYGVTESTFNAQELYRMQRDILEIERASGLLGTWGKIKLAVGAVMDYASDKYQLTEALGKTMKIMDEMERGRPEHEAALAAQEALFDYSLVSKNVRYLRNAPMGMPFLTFAVKVAPLLLKTARHHPERYLPWIALAYGLPALLAAAFDVDDDDIEALKKALPEWLQERGHAYVLPWKDDTGRWQVIDMGYFFPWTTWTEPIRMAAEGEAGKTVQALGLFSGPLTDLITAVMTGRDSFTGREIVAPGDPPKRQLLQIINYLWTMAMPPIITEHGAAGHAVRAATGQTDRFGDPLSTSGQAALRAVGVNVYPIHPETSRATNVRRMMREIADTEYALRKRLQDRGLSDEGKADLVKEYIAEVDRRRQKLMDYIEQSEVHPNLATETLQ